MSLSEHFKNSDSFININGIFCFFIFRKLLRWKMKNGNCDAKQIQSSQHAVSHCNVEFYPNISTILQLLLTLSVASFSCKRSFNSLGRLKTWSRTSMANARLNGPALAYIHKPKEIDGSSVLKRWHASGHRRILPLLSGKKKWRPGKIVHLSNCWRRSSLLLIVKFSDFLVLQV